MSVSGRMTGVGPVAGGDVIGLRHLTGFYDGRRGFDWLLRPGPSPRPVEAGDWLAHLAIPKLKPIFPRFV